MAIGSAITGHRAGISGKAIATRAATFYPSETVGTQRLSRNESVVKSWGESW
jgi:hypothetical protein